MSANAMTARNAADYEALAPEPIRCQVGGLSLQLLPLPFGATLRMLRIVAPLVRDLERQAAEPGAVLDQGTVASLMAEHALLVAPMCALGSGQPQEWVESLSEADGNELFAAVLVANFAFFSRAATQIVQAMIAARLKALAAPGKSMSNAPPSSQPSPPAGSPSSAS